MGGKNWRKERFDDKTLTKKDNKGRKEGKDGVKDYEKTEIFSKNEIMK